MFGKHKKTFAIVFAVIAVVIRNAVWPEQNVAASALQPTDGTSVVQIVHSWVEPTTDGQSPQSRLSHGAAIGPHTILTHNHFSRAAGAGAHETMTFRGADGQAMTLALNDVILEAIDAGTLLIHLPNLLTLNSAPAADRSVVEQLGFGDWLSVSYWDDDAGRHKQQDVMIIHIQDGVATLLDPERRINTGDSGSGARYQGKLVGNVWSIYTTVDGASLGVFQVALLPPQVTDIVSGQLTGRPGVEVSAPGTAQ